MSFFRTTRARTLRSNICGSQCDKPCFSRRFMRLGYNKSRLLYSPIPDPPASFTSVDGYKSVVLNWTEPAYKGNFDILYYTVKNITLDISTKVKGLTTTITGLTNQPYIFTITATNSEYYTSITYNTVTVNPYDVPGAPTNIYGESGDETINLSWEAPDSDGGSEITGYKITMSPGDVITYTTVTNTTITGLTNGTAYTFTVVAINAGGSSSGTTSSAISPGSVPDAPTITSITRGNSTASVYFDEPTDVGGNDITGYYYSINGDVNENYTLTSDTVSPIIIDGLDNDVVYTIYLKAVNVIGNSIASNSIPMTTVTVPSAPTSLSATVADGSTVVSFTAPFSDGGNDIISYKYSINDENYTSISSNLESFTINDLENGKEYTIYLKATNDIGDSEPGSTTVTPGGVPVAPSITLTPSEVEKTQITLNITTDYSLEENYKGRTITKYEYAITADENATISEEDYVSNEESPTETSIIITGLLTGTTYYVYVRAVNSLGEGLPTMATTNTYSD